MPMRAVLLTSLLVGCSALPERGHPPFADSIVHATFVVPADGRLPLPTTTTDFVVRRLELTPTADGERYDRDGTRWFHYRPGVEVQATLLWRQYGTPTERRTARQLLPTARDVHEVAP